jgi:hypothetical protein
MMRLFSRWKKDTEILSQNNRPIIIKKDKHSLFDDIVGFEDVKTSTSAAIILSDSVIITHQLLTILTTITVSAATCFAFAELVHIF